MNTREKIAQDLQMKEERVSAWEKYSSRNDDYYEEPRVEYWYLE